MPFNDYPYAGLILPDTRGINVELYLDAAQQVLARLDPRPVGVPKRSAKRHAVLGNTYGLRIRDEPNSDYGPRVLIEIVTRNGLVADDEKAARILSDMVMAALDHSPADTIEWYSPDTLLSAEDFIRLRSYVSPRREPVLALPEESAERAIEEIMETADPLDDLAAEDQDQLPPEGMRQMLLADEPDEYEPIEEDKAPYNPLERMKERMAEQQPEQVRLGFAGWAMSGILAVVFFPAAVFLWIVSLGRGMDFRLTTQVLSVTMLFVALTNSDRISLMINQVLQ